MPADPPSSVDFVLGNERRAAGGFDGWLVERFGDDRQAGEVENAGGVFLDDAPETVTDCFG